MSRALTSTTTLEQLKREAKQWLKALRTGDPEARARLLRAHPGAPADAGLRHVHHALAREFGLASWARLKVALAASAAPPEDPSAEAVRALLAGADAGDTDAVARVLDARPDLLNVRGTLPGHTGLRTALHFGVQHEPVVRLLLARGADPNIRDEGDDAFPLHFAAERQDLPVIQLLLEHGADAVGDGTHHELNVLGWATAWDYVTADPAVVACLLAHGARHTIASAVALGDVDAIRAVVAQAPAERDRAMDRTNRGRRPLHLAIVKGQLAALETLLDLGADIEATDLAGLTPLDQAALAGATVFVDRLIARGAAIHLPAAVALGRTEDVMRLVAGEPGSLSPGGRWGSLIVRAAERAPAAVVEALVRHGASVDATDDPATAVDGIGGYTALHAAAWHGNTAAADALLRLGANPRLRDARYHATPVGWADYAGKPETRDRILQGPIDLFDAIAADRADLVTAILERDPEALERPLGADAARPEEATRTPLAYAIAEGRTAIAALLRARTAGTS